MDKLPKNERRAVRLAGDALRAALAEDWPLANRVMERMAAECDWVAMQRAVLAWIDTLITRMGHTPGKPIRIAFQQVETGRIDAEDGEGVPEPVRWAGRAIAARAADDEQAWNELMDALPRDGREIGKRVAAVLETVALMLSRMGVAR